MAAVIAMLAILMIWALVSGRLARANITTAIAMVAVGTLLTAGENPVFTIDLDTKIAERAVEVALAIVLFVDATEIRPGLMRRESKVTLRLLLVALPLSLVLGWIAGYVLMPTESFWILAIITIIAVPTDLAPAVSTLRDHRIPRRLRDILNIEAGLNDGVVAPLFLICVAGAQGPGNESTIIEAIADAVPASAVAIGVGAALGLGAARLLGRAWKSGMTEPTALRLGVFALPLLAYTTAIGLQGNGFVAAFVAGVFFRSSAHLLPEDALHLVEDVGSLMTLAVWFVFGQVINQVFSEGFAWQAIVFGVLALTVVRILPVLVSLAGTNLSRRDRVFIGWTGPRGLASIVFGMLAFLDLEEPHDFEVVEVMVVVVLLSVVLHGITAGPIAKAYERRTERAAESAAEP